MSRRLRIHALTIRRECITAALVCALTVLWAAQAAQAQVTGAPAPGASPGSTFVCPLLVLSVAPIDAPEHSAAREFAFALQAFDGPAGSVSGTMSILADNRMYQVAFDRAVAVGRTSDSLKQLVPIVVQFPEAVTVNAAFVAFVRGPNAGPCEIAGAWINPNTSYKLLPYDVIQALKDRAPSVKPIASGEPGPFVKPGCDSRATPVRTTRVASATAPQLSTLRGEGGQVYAEVVVDKVGKVATAWIWSTAYDDFAAPALGAAKATLYTPAQIDCTPTSGIYIFVTSFSDLP